MMLPQKRLVKQKGFFENAIIRKTLPKEKLREMLVPDQYNAAIKRRAMPVYSFTIQPCKNPKYACTAPKINVWMVQ